MIDLDELVELWSRECRREGTDLPSNGAMNQLALQVAGAVLSEAIKRVHITSLPCNLTCIGLEGLISLKREIFGESKA